MWTLSKDAKIVRVMNAQIAGLTTLTTSIINMAGFNAVQFVALTNTVVATAVMTLQLQDNSANSVTGMANISGAAITVTDVGGATSNSAIVLDIVTPQLQYVQVTITRTVANSAWDGMIAILYRSNVRATVVDPSVVGQAFAEAAT